VLVIDVDEDEANKLLATLDPLAAMAETHKGAFKDLAGFVQTDSAECASCSTERRTSRGRASRTRSPALPLTPVARLGQIWQLGQAPAALRRFYAPARPHAADG
jgi:hypothetical protein